MNKPDRVTNAPEDGNEQDPQSRINLPLIYGLMFLGLLAAIAFAVMIVLPFYHRN